MNKTKNVLLRSILILVSCFSLTVYVQGQKKIRTIIVDAGHGGKYIGAVGEYEGTLHSQEKNITLAISLKLMDELHKVLPKVKLVPTRTTDITQDPREKAKIANDNHGDLFLCIHADAVGLKTGSRVIGHHMVDYTTKSYKGKGRRKKTIITHHSKEVPTYEYYKIPSNRKGTSTLIFTAGRTNIKIKAMENSDIFDTEQNDSSLNVNYDSPEWKASALLYTQLYFKKSYKLGTLVQKEIADMGRVDDGVWQREKGIWVLQATSMPAILIETGFIANYEDERYLNSEKGQTEIAQAIARAVVKYKEQVENPQANLKSDSIIGTK